MMMYQLQILLTMSEMVWDIHMETWTTTTKYVRVLIYWPTLAFGWNKWRKPQIPARWGGVCSQQALEETQACCRYILSLYVCSNVSYFCIL